MEKVTKNNLTIISKAHAHLYTMEKTHAKFQNDWYKTVGGVVLTRHPAKFQNDWYKTELCSQDTQRKC